MDVRCEKCQTEYELDEARLKPGGVTVKCTNCGHMFKIRKRATTNVGTPSPPAASLGGRENRDTGRPRTPSPRPPRGDSMFDDGPGGEEAPTTIDRQWLIRLDNGEQKSCRELATLQQWIIAGVVTRESLISRSGKTWKRLGDIADLGQYFAIADEARANRDRVKQVSRPVPAIPTTLPGYTAAQAAGGTILPDDPDDGIDAATIRSPMRVGVPTPPPVPRIAARTPAPVGTKTAAMSATVPSVTPPAPQRAPRTTPPPPPPAQAWRPATPPPPIAQPQLIAQPPAPPQLPPVTPVPPQAPHAGSPAQTSIIAAQPPPLPQNSRATAAWAVDAIKQVPSASSTQPFIGKISAAAADEPAFAGRVRMVPGDESTFQTGKVKSIDDDDDLLPGRRGSRVGTLVLIMALLVMAGAAAVVYVFVIKPNSEQQAAAPDKQPAPTPPVTAVVPPADAAVAVVTAPAVDAADVAPPAQISALDAARDELRVDVEPRLRTSVQTLDAATDAPSLALRAQLLARIAQDAQDRASVMADKAAADAARKDAKQLALDAATSAQRALKAAPTDATANLAMADVLRLQGKPARDITRYLDSARTNGASKRDLAISDALVLARDGKLDDARAELTAIDQGDDKLEASGDVRARFHLALLLTAQNKPAEAKPLVAQVLAAQPEHIGAKALSAKLDTLVATSDPLPPEDGSKAPAQTPAPTGTSRPVAPVPTRQAPTAHPAAPDVPTGGDPYDRIVARAKALADSNCSKAMELYAKALEQKPNGVEALTGMGFCQIDAKLFASAASKFRAALAVSPRYEPALRGIAEGYMQQGLKDRAIEAYRAYLDVFPDNAFAKKQLERLGADAAPAQPAPPPAPAPAAPAPAPAAPPTPAQPAPDPGAGSGSG